MNVRFALVYAASSLARGGRRTLLAGLCIAFGVASLVSLQLLANAVNAVVGVDPRLVTDGDARLHRNGDTVSSERMRDLDRDVAAGAIARYSPVATVPTRAIRVVGTADMHFAGRVLGVDPARYPLLGSIRFRDGSPASLGDALSANGAAVVTRDLAARLGVEVGSALVLAGALDREPAQVTVSSIVESVPDRRGDTILLSLETAKALVGREDVVTEVSVLWGGEAPPAHLTALGWSVAVPEEVTAGRAHVVEFFDLMFKGAGLLGLLLGGVGVSNTLGVLLARRRGEIAALKSIGYTRFHLVLLFGAEAAMLGVAGAAAGALAGAALAAWLTRLLGQTGFMLLEWSPEPPVLAGAVVTGSLTAVAFALHAIVKASSVRPAVLLRDHPTPPARLESLAIFGVLGAVFAAMCGLVLGSATRGALVALVGFAGLALLGALLGGAFWLAVRIPVPVPPLLHLARRSLRQETPRVVVALVALTCGVFAIGFAATAMGNAKRQFDARQGTLDGTNIKVYAMRGDVDQIAATLVSAGGEVARRPADGSVSAVVEAAVPPERLREVATGVSRDFPSAVVLGKHVYNDAAQRAVENLFYFAIAVAGLALVAGAVLIANAVGLSMVARQREIGVLKAIGFARRQVLLSVTAEYLLLGVIAGLFGIAGVAVAISAINVLQPRAGMTLDGASALATIAVSAALAALSALAVARHPASKRPLAVLRSE